MLELIHLLFSLLCYATFVYQFVTVTRDYLKYKTITKVEYRTEESIELPALTVTFQTPIPMLDLFIKAFPKAKTYPYATFGSLGPEFRNSTLGQHCFEIYDRVEKDAWDLINWKRFDNNAIWECVFNHFGNNPIKEYLTSLPQCHGWYLSCYSVGDNRSPDCQNISLCDPNLARYRVGFRGAIGITLFSKFSPDCLNLTAGGLLTVHYKYARIMPFKGWYNYVQMHQSDGVPNFSRFQSLDLKMDQTLRYNRIVFKRLPPPYDTLCHDYKRAPLNGANSQCDCIAACRFAGMVDSTSNGTSFNLFFSKIYGYFVKAKEFPKEALMSDVVKDKQASKVFDVERWRRVKKACQTKCPVDCGETVFKWTMVAIERDWEVVTMILKHDYDSDQLFSHLLAMDLFTFFGNVGGLAGMWIGFSILSCWSSIHKHGSR